MAGGAIIIPVTTVAVAVAPEPVPPLLSVMVTVGAEV